MLEIIPAILETSFPEIEKKIRILEDLNPVDTPEKIISWIQIDLADGTLVPNTTFLDPEPFRRFADDSNNNSPNSPSYSKSGLGGVNLELHLMVTDPLMYLERFAKAGFKRFYAHVEGGFVDEYIARGYQLGVEVGLAINGPTPFDRIHKYLDNIDCLLVMAIEAGFSGKPFREDTIAKIKRIREADLEIPVAVDGAMNVENAKKVIEAGANRICSNSYIFNSPDIKASILSLKTKE